MDLFWVYLWLWTEMQRSKFILLLLDIQFFKHCQRAAVFSHWMLNDFGESLCQNCFFSVWIIKRGRCASWAQLLDGILKCATDIIMTLLKAKTGGSPNIYERMCVHSFCLSLKNLCYIATLNTFHMPTWGHSDFMSSRPCNLMRLVNSEIQCLISTPKQWDKACTERLDWRHVTQPSAQHDLRLLCMETELWRIQWSQRKVLSVILMIRKA